MSRLGGWLRLLFKGVSRVIPGINLNIPSLSSIMAVFEEFEKFQETLPPEARPVDGKVVLGFDGGNRSGWKSSIMTGLFDGLRVDGGAINGRSFLLLLG